MSEVADFVKKPMKVRAIQWQGTNESLAEIQKWTYDESVGESFFRARTVSIFDTEEPEFTAQVYDYLHEQWIDLRTGDWVLQGSEGEFYPHNGPLFVKNYEPYDPAKHGDA